MEKDQEYDEAFAQIGFGRFQLKVFLYAILGSFTDAMQLTLLTYVGPATEAELQLNPEKQNWIAISTYTAMIIGAYIWSIVANRWGRKIGILGSALLTTIGVLGSCASSDFLWLLILRGIAGLGLGGANISTTWGSEFVPNLSRIIAMVSLFVSYSLGTSLEAWIARFVVPNYGWRWLLGLSSLPSVLALLFYKSVPESPHFLKTNGRIGEAIHVLKAAALENKREWREHSLLSAYTDPTTDETMSEPLISAENMALENASSGDQIPKDKGFLKNCKLLLDLVLSVWRKSSLRLWALYFLSNYAYYVIILAALDIKKQDGNDPKFYGNLYTILLTEFFGLCVAVGLMAALSKFLRMSRMMAIGFVLFVIETIDLCTVITNWQFMTTIFVSGSVAMVQLYAEKVYPMVSKTAGIQIATAAGRFVSLALPLAAAALNSDTHKLLPTILFIVKILLSAICALKCPYETE